MKDKVYAIHVAFLDLPLSDSRFLELCLCLSVPWPALFLRLSKQVANRSFEKYSSPSSFLSLLLRSRSSSEFAAISFLHCEKRIRSTSLTSCLWTLEGPLFTCFEGEGWVSQRMSKGRAGHARLRQYAINECSGLPGLRHGGGTIRIH